MATNTNNSAIVGAWSFAYGVITFLPNGTYFHAEVNHDQGDAYDNAHTPSGMEYGTYSWDSATGKFSSKTLVDTNELAGLSNPTTAQKANPPKVSVVGDKLTLGDFSFPRVTSATNPIVGSWYKAESNVAGKDDTAHSKAVLTFLADGTYFMADDGNSITDPSGQDGMEKGTYSWDAKSGNFSATTLVDTNGEWGLSDTTFPKKITISSGKMSVDGIELGTSVGSTNTAPKPVNGNDSIIGTDGNDTLDGGLGKDTLTGGNGDDTYIVDNKADKVIEAKEAGTDTVLSKISYTLGNNLENLELLGTTKINGTGNALNNVISGNDENNVLNGMAGNDELRSGKGADKLTGGKGADIFKFSSAYESGDTAKTRDTITDFKHSEGDKIDLSGLGGLTIIGTQPFSTTDATGEARWDKTAHIIYVSTDADNQPEFSVLLSGVKELALDDFIL